MNLAQPGVLRVPGVVHRHRALVITSYSIHYTKLYDLSPKANESRKGFLLNHLISEELPATAEGEHLSNSDPVTGQAGWYDVRVRVYKAQADEPQETFPQFAPMKALPGSAKRPRKWLAYRAGSGLFKNLFK